MRALGEGLINAFARYSVLPMPKIPHGERSVKGTGYTLCFLPLIGVLSGVLLLLWHGLCTGLGLSPLLFAAVAAALDTAVSGGEHMAGFMGAVDALASHGVQERKRELLHSRQAGRHGAAAAACLLLVRLGLWHQLWETAALLPLAALSFVWARGLAALSVAILPGRKSAAPGATAGAGLVYLLACLAAFLAVSPAAALAVLAGSALLLAIHRYVAVWEFGEGGAVLAGLLLEQIQLLCLLVAAVGSALAVMAG